MDLWGLSYSPWTEQAKWALEHHRIEYRLHPYVPFVREAALRFQMKKFWGRVTVPVLIDGKTVYPDSLDIIRLADRIGQGEPLLPPELAQQAESWKARADATLSAARGLVTRRVRASDAALRESVPRGTPEWLKRPLAVSGLWLFSRKYGLPADGSSDEARIAETLDALRAELLRSGGQYVLGRFSLADISMAAMLQIVKPVDARYMKLSEGMRESWATPILAERYEDLLAWRDTVYARHRPVLAR